MRVPLTRYIHRRYKTSVLVAEITEANIGPIQTLWKRPMASVGQFLVKIPDRNHVSLYDAEEFHRTYRLPT